MSVLALALPLVASSAPRAVAEPVADCTTTSGVIVAVDFSHFGGHIERGCAPTPTNGFDAVHAAGFTTEGDEHDGPGFVCRIDGDPTPAEQPCRTTPPASAYWSYWHADPGKNTWQFSSGGAMAAHPQPGSVDAWVFGSTEGGGTHGEPTFSPASVRASRVAATPTPSRSATPRATSMPHGSGRSLTTPTASPSSTPTASTARPRHPHATGHVRTAVAVPDTSPSGVGAVITDVSPATASKASTSHGTPIGVIVGVALVIAVAAMAGFVSWRRRRESP